jgi:hypothetical protein
MGEKQEMNRTSLNLPNLECSSIMDVLEKEKWF